MRRQSNQPGLPWWARIPFLVGVLALVPLIISAVIPWFTGDFDHARLGPQATIWMVVALTVLASVMMGRESGWSWVPGVLVLAMGVMILMYTQPEVVCPTDIEYDGNIAEACFTEEETAGTWFFAVGVFAAALASFISPRLTRVGDDYAQTRQRVS